jgi:hypothetical protein
VKEFYTEGAEELYIKKLYIEVLNQLMPIIRLTKIVVIPFITSTGIYSHL